MEFWNNIKDIAWGKGRQAADKAKELAEIARLKGQIALCREVIKKNQLEIGQLYVEQYADQEDAPFRKQVTAVLNAENGIREIERQINEIKGENFRVEEE